MTGPAAPSPASSPPRTSAPPPGPSQDMPGTPHPGHFHPLSLHPNDCLSKTLPCRSPSKHPLCPCPLSSPRPPPATTNPSSVQFVSHPGPRAARCCPGHWGPSGAQNRPAFLTRWARTPVWETPTGRAATNGHRNYPVPTST